MWLLHLSRVGPTLYLCVMLYHCRCAFPYLLPPSTVCLVLGALLWVGDVSVWRITFCWRPWTPRVSMGLTL